MKKIYSYIMVATMGFMAISCSDMLDTDWKPTSSETTSRSLVLPPTGFSTCAPTMP